MSKGGKRSRRIPPPDWPGIIGDHPTAGHVVYMSAVEFAWRQAARHWLQGMGFDPRLERSCLDVLDWIPYFIQSNEVTEDGQTFVCVPLTELCKVAGIGSRHTAMKAMSLLSQPTGPLVLIKDWPKGLRLGKCYTMRIPSIDGENTCAISPGLMHMKPIRDMCTNSRVGAHDNDVENFGTCAIDGSSCAIDGSSCARTPRTSAHSLSLSLSIGEDHERIREDVERFKSSGWKGCRPAAYHEIATARRRERACNPEDLSYPDGFLLASLETSPGYFPPEDYVRERAAAADDSDLTEDERSTFSRALSDGTAQLSAADLDAREGDREPATVGVAS